MLIRTLWSIQILFVLICSLMLWIQVLIFYRHWDYRNARKTVNVILTSTQTVTNFTLISLHAVAVHQCSSFTLVSYLRDTWHRKEYIIEFVKGIIIYFSKHENYSIQNYTVFHYVDLKWKVFAPDKSFSNTLTKCGV